MLENSIKISRTARYFVIGEPGPEISQVWFACHGYGQLAFYFARNFECLDNGKTLVVVPEALSRFYLEGGHGRIGACWMTKEDRLNEIVDYVSYLDALAEMMLDKLPKSVKKTVFGFSQGTATVSRWISQGRISADRLILWGGSLPVDFTEPDTDFSRFHNLSVCFVRGDEDTIISSEKMAAHHKLLKDHHVSSQIITFPGGHKIPAEILQSVARNET